MRKISIICRSPGSFYPVRLADLAFKASVTLLFMSYGNCLFAQIMMPPPPSAAPPPAQPAEKNPITLKKIEREQKKADEKKKTEQVVEEKKKQTELENAKAEAQQKRPLYGFFEISLLKPTATVSKSRSDYHCDPTSHVSAYLRMFFDKDPTMSQAWVGLRIAPFSGYGTQKNFTGRFALTFAGPAIGIGRVNAASDPVDDFPSRFTWLWSGGVAGLSRLAADEEHFKGVPSDFKPKGWIYESPGLWSEIRWTMIIRGALGYGGVMGAQTATGKTFYYAGLTASGFY